MPVFPKRRADLTTRDVNGETLILDRKHEDVHQLNNSASYVWQCCDGRMTSHDIAVAMAMDFSIVLEAAERDVASLISQLVALGLLETQ